MSSPAPLRLFTFPPAWGLPTSGPFGLKLEACLQMLGVPYERCYEMDNRKGPKRKSPWIEEGSVRMGDTELILAHLQRTRGLVLDRGVDAETRARGHALRRMLEEGFHQVFEYELVLCEEGFPVMRALAQESFGSMMGGLAVRYFRGAMRKHLFERGIARHAPAEVEAIGRADVDSLVGMLGDRPFFFGDEPTKADATAFGLLAVSIKSPLPTPVCSYARSQPTLVAYVERALSRFVPEWPPAGAR